MKPALAIAVVLFGLVAAPCAAAVAASDDFELQPDDWVLYGRYLTSDSPEYWPFWDYGGRWLTLTQDAGSRADSAFWKRKLPSDTFTATFRFRLPRRQSSGSVGEGMTFVWADMDDPNGKVGRSGSGLGYQYNASPYSNPFALSYAVEFDSNYSYENGATGHHVAWHRNGQLEDNNRTNVTLTITAEPNGIWHNAKIVVSGSGANRTLSVYVDSMSTPVMEATLADYAVHSAYFGFTAATGGASGLHQVDDFVLEIP